MRDRKFSLFHLSLVPLHGDLFISPPGSREDWLRNSLSKSFSFPHRGGDDLFWVPIRSDHELIMGLVQKKQKHEAHQSPEEGGGELVVDEWQGAYILLDPTHHDDGQKAAVENDVVGKPSALLKSLVAALNNQPERHYHIEIEAIFNADKFWEFAAKHGKKLRRIKFEFVVPNMWDTASALAEDLKETGEQTGAQRVKIEFSATDGVRTMNQKIVDGVEYSGRGAGSLTATAMNGERFNSKSTQKTASVPPTTETGNRISQYFYGLRDRILGRDAIPPVVLPGMSGDDPADSKS